MKQVVKSSKSVLPMLRIIQTEFALSLLIMFCSLGTFGEINAAENAQSSEKHEPSNIKSALGISYSTGSMGSQSGGISKRIVDSAAIYGRTGYRSGFLEPFIVGEYSYAIQSTPGSLTANTNLGGSGYFLGGGLAMVFQRLRLSGTFIGYGAYSLKQTDSSNQKVTYSDPLGARYGISFNIKNCWTISAFYSDVEYSTLKQNSSKSSIGSDKLYYSNVGVGIEVGF